MLLSFKEKFRTLIREGKKVQTLRVWKSCPVQPGSVVLCPKLGKVRITSVDRVALSKLTPADAELEGLPTVEDLVKTIRKIYSLGKTADARCFRIRFVYLGKKGSSSPAPAATDGRRKEAQKPGLANGKQLRFIKPF